MIPAGSAAVHAREPDRPGWLLDDKAALDAPRVPDREPLAQSGDRRSARAPGRSRVSGSHGGLRLQDGLQSAEIGGVLATDHAGRERLEEAEEAVDFYSRR